MRSRESPREAQYCSAPENRLHQLHLLSQDVNCFEMSCWCEQRHPSCGSMAPAGKWDTSGQQESPFHQTLTSIITTTARQSPGKGVAWKSMVRVCGCCAPLSSIGRRLMTSKPVHEQRALSEEANRGNLCWHAPGRQSHSILVSFQADWPPKVCIICRLRMTLLFPICSSA